MSYIDSLVEVIKMDIRLVAFGKFSDQHIDKAIEDNKDNIKSESIRSIIDKLKNNPDYFKDMNPDMFKQKMLVSMLDIRLCQFKESISKTELCQIKL